MVYRQCRRSSLKNLPAGSIANSYWWIKSITTYERMPMAHALVMTVPLLFTNVVATACIAVKVWYMHPLLNVTRIEGRIQVVPP